MEFKQSNIGLFQPEDEGNNIGGNAKLVGNKLFIYGRGDRKEAERDLAEGLVGFSKPNSLQRQLARGNRNSSVLQVPDWFDEGLVNTSAILYQQSPRHMLDAGKTGDLGWIEGLMVSKQGKFGQGFGLI